METASSVGTTRQREKHMLTSNFIIASDFSQAVRVAAGICVYVFPREEEITFVQMELVQMSSNLL